MAFKYLSTLKSQIINRILVFPPLLLWNPHLHPSSLFYHLSTATASFDSNGSGNGDVREQRLVSWLKQCSTMKDLNKIHAHIIRAGFDQNLFVVGRILVFCAVSHCGSMDYAVSVFESIEIPDGFLWNTMIRGFVNKGRYGAAVDYYKSMLGNGEVADNFTFSFLLKVCGQVGSVLLGRQIHCNALKHGLESHVFVRNTLVHMYGMLRDVETAAHLFNEIAEPDLVAWNTVIDCHVGCREYKEALKLFSRTLEGGIHPDDVTLVVTLSACSALGALDFGRWLHSRVNESNLGNVVSVSNSLIDMYAKCGAVDEAFRTFTRMNERNVVSWNTIILALAVHGRSTKALELFSKMLEEGLEVPNDVTFLGVLCACSHRGMVEEGRRYFNSMLKEYHIKPTIKHYGSMVDILGRAGLVVEAHQLIKSMPMECNAVVWRTLLAACRLHENVELGEQVRRHILELEPDHSSDYALLASTYAGLGEYNEAIKLRRLMQTRGVQKPKPGNSLIGIHPSLYEIRSVA